MRRLLTALAVSVAAFASAAAFAQTPDAQPTAPPGDAVRGKANFMSYGCYECHGTMAQGNYFGGPHLAPSPPAWAVVSAYVRKPALQMPSFNAKILPERDLADIYAYLRSIPPAKSPSQIPALAGVSTSSK